MRGLVESKTGDASPITLQLPVAREWVRVAAALVDYL